MNTSPVNATPMHASPLNARQVTPSTATSGELYTKNGVPMTLRGDDLFDCTGRQVGHRHGDKVYAFGGRYAATIVGDRLVHRGADDTTTAPPFARRRIAATGRARRPGIFLHGAEPFGDVAPPPALPQLPSRQAGAVAARTTVRRATASAWPAFS